MIVADTDVLIDYLAGRGAAAERVSIELERGGLCTTAITRFELLSGAKKIRHETTVRDMLSARFILPLDALAADRSAAIRIELENVGGTIGMADTLIAGIVLTNGGILLTRNTKHFRRVQGLSILDASN